MLLFLLSDTLLLLLPNNQSSSGNASTAFAVSVVKVVVSLIIVERSDASVDEDVVDFVGTIVSGGDDIYGEGSKAIDCVPTGAMVGVGVDITPPPIVLGSSVGVCSMGTIGGPMATSVLRVVNDKRIHNNRTKTMNRPSAQGHAVVVGWM